MNERMVINFAIGATVGAVLALALAVVAFDLAQLPRLWAYVFLALICIVIVVNVVLLVRGNRFFSDLLGIKTSDLNDVLKAASKDVEAGEFGRVIKDRLPDLFSHYATFRARMIAAFLLLALLGELVLVVQVSALIEQTIAIKTQTERFTQQTQRDLFWQMHNDVEHSNRVRAFRELLVIGQIEFNDFQFRNVDLSGMNLPNVRFRGSDFSGSTFVGVTMQDASIENTIMRDSDFSGAKLSGRFDGSNFAGSNFTGATVTGSLRSADFSGTDFSDADLSDSSLDRANLTGAVVNAGQLATVTHLQSVIGVPDDIMQKVKDLNPELLQHWSPN